jgi:hypothetical protein
MAAVFYQKSIFNADLSPYSDLNKLAEISFEGKTKFQTIKW